MTRAQTPVDYGIGMGLFLVTLVLVIGFLPSVFQPFEGATGTETIVAERGADRLADDLLVVNETAPVSVNESCAETFFDADDASECRYGGDAATLNDALGVDSSANVNVTIRDGAGVRTVGTTRLAAGPEAAPNDFVSARRTVMLGDEAHWLVVKAW